MIWSIWPHLMAWKCLSFIGNDSLWINDDVITDKSSRVNCELYQALLSAIHCTTHWTVLYSTDGRWPKAFLRQRSEMFYNDQVSHLTRIRCFIYHQNLKTAAVKVRQSITWDETQRLLIFMASRLQLVIDWKGFPIKY